MHNLTRAQRQQLAKYHLSTWDEWITFKAARKAANQAKYAAKPRIQKPLYEPPPSDHIEFANRLAIDAIYADDDNL